MVNSDLPESAMPRTFLFALPLIASASLSAGPPAEGPAAGPCGGAYTVVRGDTLYSIARRCRTSVDALAAANRLGDPRRIEIGQRLAMSGPEIPFPMAKPEPASETDAALAYRFQPGDTLYSLARWARVGVGALIAAYPGIDPHKIEIGDDIRLPAGAVSPEPARLREFGNGPGPALVRPGRVMVQSVSPPPRAAPPPHPAPPPPRPAPSPPPPPPREPEMRRHHAVEAPPMPGLAKPDTDERRAPEGM
jgi:LysM repeat protein